MPPSLLMQLLQQRPQDQARQVDREATEKAVTYGAPRADFPLGAVDIKDGAISNPKLADAAVDTEELADGAVTNAKVAGAAAIAYSKLNLAGGIVNADVSASAAIAYSKLALAGSIQVADLAFDPATQTELNSHAGNASAHHSRYTDNEARTAVGGQIETGTYSGNGVTSGRTISIGLNADAVWVMHTNTDNRPGYWTTSDNAAINGAGSTANVHLNANGDLVVGDGGNDANVSGVPYKWVAIG